MFIGPASAPGALIASVDAPWRTSTPGQSISAGVLALVVALSCAGGPNNQEFILSVMLCADAGCESDPTMMAAAAQMRVVKALLIFFPSLWNAVVIAGQSWPAQDHDMQDHDCRRQVSAVPQLPAR